MKKLIVAVWVLLILLLSTNTCWFIYFDKKIDKLTERQEGMNSWCYEQITQQEKTIRLIETNNEIMASIIVNGDYYEKD